jgi:hypothetical protein
MSLSDNFQAFEDAVKDGLSALATGTLKSAAADIRSDVEAFLEASAEDLKRRGDLLAKGDLTREEFEFLLKSQADIARMIALSQRGISKARIGQFKRSLTSLVLRAAFAAIGI